MDTEIMRTAAACIYIAVEEKVADSIAELLRGAADEIERLRKELEDAKRADQG